MTDDIISRQAAIDAIDTYIGNFDAIDANFLDGLKTAKKLMMQLPSAQPERKPGRWMPHKSKFGGEDEKVYTCDQCGHNIGFHAENFCPNCGSDMKGGE